MTASHQVHCPKCGAALPLEGATQTVVCRYCGTSTLLPPDVWQRLHPPPPAPIVVVTPASSGVGAVVGLAIALAVVGGVVAIAMFALRGASRSTVARSGPPAEPVNPIASAGEPCNGRRAACSTDKAAQLSCGDDGKMVISASCRGPNGCRVTEGGDSVSCDATLAAAKDPCTTTESACATSHKAELRCQAGRYVVISTCRGPDGCTVTPSGKGSGFTLSCDDHIADAGDPCFDATRTACSSDKSALLTCNAQRFAVDRKCPKGCTVKKVPGTDKKEMRCD